MEHSRQISDMANADKKYLLIDVKTLTMDIVIEGHKVFDTA